MSWALLFVALAHSQELVPLAAPASVGVLAVTLLAHGVPRRIPFTVALPLAFVVIAGVIITLNQLDSVLARGIGYWADEARAVYASVLVMVVATLWSSRASWVDVVRAGLWASVPICLASLFALYVLPIQVGDLELGAMHKPDRHVTIGLLGTKNPFAGSIGQILIAVAAWFAVRDRPPRSLSRWSERLAVLVLAGAFVVAGSRGFSVGLLAALIFVQLRTPRTRTKTKSLSVSRRGLRRGVGVAGVTLIAVSVFASNYMSEVGRLVAEDENNVVRRFALYYRALNIVSVSPLTGLGPGAVSQTGLRWSSIVPGAIAVRSGGQRPEEFIFVGDLPIGQHAHNTILQGLADYGVLGFGVFLIPLFLAMRWPTSASPVGTWHPSAPPALSSSGSIPSPTSLTFVIRALFVYLLVSGMFGGYTLFTPSMSWMLFVLVGVRLSQVHLHSPRR